MTTRVPALVLAAALLPAAASAEELPAHVFAAAPRDETQDVLFLADARPVFLRFRIRVAGDGFRTAWGDFADRLHRFLDGDGDGVLTPQEARRGTWQQLLQSPVGPRRANPASNAGPTGLDSNPQDGRVSVAELASYLRSALGFGEFGVQPGPPLDPKTQAIFGHLDSDHDGKLSPAELAATDACLGRLDLDEDELISLAEMLPFQNPYADRFRGVPAPTINRDDDSGPFVVLGSDEIPPRLIQRLLGKYDRAATGGVKDGRLGPAELGIDPDAFRRCDADGDGGLGPVELAALLRQPPCDLALRVALGNAGQAGSKIEVDGTPRSPISPSHGAANRADKDPLRIELEGVVVEFLIEDNINDVRIVYKRQFNVADADKNGYVDKPESGRNAFFQQIFPVADRDGDGKLFEKELEAYVDRQSDAIGSRTLLTISDRGRALFEILDADGDQKLGLRELRRARERLAAADRDGDGRVARDELPHHYRLGVGRGQAPLRRGFAIEPYDTPDPPGRVGGPPWFERMDRNRDGDVSPREFLGTRDDFRRFDTDGDGLIDPREAGKVP